MTEDAVAALIQEALEARARRDLGTAVELFARAATLVMGVGQVARALELYRAVVEIDPAHAEAAAAVGQLEGAIRQGADRLGYLLGGLAVEHRHSAPYVEFAGRPYGAHADGNQPTGDRLDAWGFPNRAPPSRDKPAHELRIFVLGDSTFFNGPNLAGTVPALLESYLHGHGLPRARVYNFAIVSAIAMQMAVLLQLRLADFAPDLVIACNGAVDLLSAREYDPRPGYPYNFFMLERLHAHFFEPGDVQALDRRQFLERAAAYQIQLRVETEWSSAAWEARVVDAYLDSVDKLARVAAAHEIDTVLVLEPMVATRANPSADELGYLKPETLAYYQRQYARLRAGLFGADERAVRWATSLTIRDGSAAFAGATGTVYRDYMHFNPEGSRRMVEFLAGIVRERVG